jgi:cell division septation protein DedD
MSKKKSSERPKPGAQQQSRKELLMKVVLSSLVCLWMFFLGLLVGRGTAPVRFDIERLQDELAALKAATIEETLQQYQVALQDLDREQNLGFHEELRDEETRLPSPASPPAVSASDPATGQATETPAAPGPTVPKKTKGAEFQKPAAGQKAEAPKTQGEKTVEAAVVWEIQVAATKDKNQGNQLVERLLNQGYSAYLAKAAVDGKGTWYRVRVGGYTSRGTAETDLAKLKKEQFSPMIVSP